MDGYWKFDLRNHAFAFSKVRETFHRHVVSCCAKTKNGGNLHIINLCQFTANDEGQQDVVWKLTNAWIS